MPASENRTAVRGIYRSMKARDLRAFKALVHPELEVRQPAFLPYGGAHRGVDAVIAMFREVLKVIDVSRLTLVSVISEDEEVWAEFVVQAVIDGSDLTVAEHWRFDGGRARELDVWFQDPTALIG